MIGVFFALLASIFKGTEKVLHRYVLAKEDSLSYAFIWHSLSSLLLLPFFIINFSLPSSPFAWGFVLLSSILWAIIAYTGYKSYSLLDVSVKTPFGKSKSIFVLLLSAIFLKEVLSLEKILGVLIIVIGIFYLSYKKGSRLGHFSEKGVQLVLFSSFLMAIALIIDKFAMNYFNPGTYSFLVYFIPTLILCPFIINKKSELKSIFRTNLLPTIGTVLCGVAYYYSMLTAFNYADASIVVPLIEVNVLITVFSGIFILKEKKMVFKKVLSSIIIIIGAILLSGIISF